MKHTILCTPLLLQLWGAIPHLPHSGVDWRGCVRPAAGKSRDIAASCSPQWISVRSVGLRWRDFWASPGLPVLMIHVAKWFRAQVVELDPWPAHPANCSCTTLDCWQRRWPQKPLQNTEMRSWVGRPSYNVWQTKPLSVNIEFCISLSRTLTLYFLLFKGNLCFLK